jgi:hypothetical protein
VRKIQQKRILDLIDTLGKAQSAGMYADCQECALQIGGYIEELEGEGTVTVVLLEDYCEVLYRVSVGEVYASELKKSLLAVRDSVKSELKPNKFKALFLPYYDNTWETMKSVYLAFAADPTFDTEIVIIPILRNTNDGIKRVWEDYLTPVGIPNTHYDLYSFEDDMPDVVFYNQPYDGVNVPKFQSQNIRKYAGKMVYIPYGVVPIGVQGKSFEHAYTELDSIKRCDVYIAQSEQFREFYLKGKPLYRKALAVGNPKQDGLYDAKAHGEFEHYPEWESRIGNRRVILLNTHYSAMLDGVEAHSGVKRLIDAVATSNDLFLIWRPHPQAFLMKLSAPMRVMLDFVQAHDRMILDRMPSMTPAYTYSHAVVSLFPSSIVMDALFLDLPVFLLGRMESCADASNIPFYSAIAHEDYSVPKDDTKRGIFAPLDKFLCEISNGEDSICEARGVYRIREFPDLDGTVALNILYNVR